MLLAINAPLIKYYTLQKYSILLIIKGKWMEGTKIHSNTVWIPYPVKNLFDFNGQFLKTSTGMQDQAHWAHTGHKKHLLQTLVDSMQTAAWLFKSKWVYLWSVWPQLNNTVCKSNIHGPLDNFTFIIQVFGLHTLENPL